MVRMYKVCDFFSGLHGWTQILRWPFFAPYPSDIFSIDNNPAYAENTTIIGDFLDLTAQDVIDHFGGLPDIVVASPPCTTFSIASCSTHWHPPNEEGERIPKSEAAVIGVKLLEHLIKLLKELDCLFFIENPRGLMRKMPIMQEFTRHTIWYCQYGDKRAKPTDIWTNSKTWKPRPPCKNNNPKCDHERAPRGSKTGTQGLANNAERSRIPLDLGEEILRDVLLC